MAINIDLDTNDLEIYSPNNDTAADKSNAIGEPCTIKLSVPSSETQSVLFYVEGLHSGYPSNDGETDEGSGGIIAPGESEYIRMGVGGKTNGIQAIHAKVAASTGHVNCYRVTDNI